MLESKRRAGIFISLSLLFALIAGFLFLQKVQALNTSLGETTEIYVANTDIASRTVIQPEDITTKEIPNKYISDSYVTKKSTILGNKVSVVPLTKGSIITKSILNEVEVLREANNRLVRIYASSKVRFDQQTLNQSLVDIVVSQQFEGKPVTEFFMTDVPVAKVIKSEKENKFYGILVEVPAEKAPELIHMQNYADSIRILKATVSNASVEPEQPESDSPEDTATEQPAEPATEQPEEQTSEEQPTQTEKKQPEETKENTENTKEETKSKQPEQKEQPEKKQDEQKKE